MLLKPWHFLFPFHSESLIKLSPVPGQPSLPACRRPAGPARASRSLSAGPGPCPEGSAVLPRDRVGTGSPPLPDGLTRSRGRRCPRSQVFPRPRFLQCDPRLGSQSMHGQAAPCQEFRVETRKRIPGGCRRLASHQRARGVEWGSPAPQAAAELRTESKPGGPALPAERTLHSRGGRPAPADGSGQGGSRSHSPTAACCSSGGKAEAAAAAPLRRH